MIIWRKSRKISEEEAIKDITRGLAPGGFLLVYYTPNYDPERLWKALRGRCDEFVGCSSYRGVFTPEGFVPEPAVAGLWLSPEVARVGALGVSAEPGEIAGALEEALGGLPYPEIVWMHPSLGSEERVVEVLARVFPEAKVLGGTPGGGSALWTGGVVEEGVVLAAMHPLTGYGYAFVSGYLPTERRGVASGVEGRMVRKIGGEPAALVYNRWTDGLVSELLGREASVLELTTLHPLGVLVGEEAGTPAYKLLHPHKVFPDMSLSLFGEVSPGDELVLMEISRRGLVEKLRDAAEAALVSGALEPDEVLGGLLVYCAGNAMAIGQELDRAVLGAIQALGGAPVVGPATLGEQGPLLGGRLHHSNLMGGLLIFGKI